MAVNLKLLHYAREMANVKPQQLREATESAEKFLENSKLINGLVEDVFDSKTMDQNVKILKKELAQIKFPKDELNKFGESLESLTDNLVDEPAMMFNNDSISKSQAFRMKLKKSIKQNEPLKNYLINVNEHLGKSEAAKNVSSTFDNIFKYIYEKLAEQPDVPNFVKHNMEISADMLKKGTLQSVRDYITYLTK